MGAALRFSTLDLQSFWLDEAFTVVLVREDLGGLLDGVARTESTPPLYYLLAWVWANAFGTGEAGLRSLSALLGTAAIPVAYGAAARLASPRAGLVAALLVAVNPMLVWYSQEARSYALLVLLGALSFYFWAGAWVGGRRAAMVGWAVTSALAVATHYFAVFLVLPEGIWLLAMAASRRAAVVANAAVLATGAALAPLALEQRGNGAFIAELDLVERIGAVPKKFMLGEPADRIDNPLVVGTGVLLALAAAILLLRRERRDRRPALVALGVAGAVVALPLVLVAVGVDYFNARNALAALVPAAVAVAIGLASPSGQGLRLAVAGGLCALWVAVVVAVAVDRDLQREDWRGLAERLEADHGERVLVVTPTFGFVPLSLYLPAVPRLPASGAPVHELLVIDVAASPAEPPSLAPHPRFTLRERATTPSWSLGRYASTRAVTVVPSELSFRPPRPEAPVVLLQSPPP